MKVAAEHAWFAARPSGTEDVYMIYAESFFGEDLLRRVPTEESGSVISGGVGFDRFIGFFVAFSR